MIKALALSAVVGQTLKSFTAEVTTAALNELRDLVEAGDLVTVVDRTYPLADAPAAVRLVEEGRPAGKVIVVVEHPH
jgi:NADPH:quinone reductase-like Zn-dependent oxidoreductase